MTRHLYLFIFVLLLSALAQAQDAVPTPTPTPTAEINDIQNVRPENLQSVPVIAPKFQSDERDLPALGIVGVDLMRQKTLSLKDAIELALENNKDIEVTRQNVRIAEFDLQAFRGVYEPRFSGQSFYERSTVPNISIFSTNRTTTTGAIAGNATLQGSVSRYGTQLSATFSSQRITTNNPISILSPQYNSSLSFNVVQPLFRGRKFDQTRRVIEIAKRNLSLTDTQFRQKTIEIVTNVQRAYWDLVFAIRNLQVQRDGVRDAKKQLEHNRRLVEEGQLAPIDIVAAETQVALIEQGVYEALENVNRTANFLKNLIAKNRNDSIWSESIVPTDSVVIEVPKTTLTEAVDLAMRNRPELELNESQREINLIEQRFYREQSKPQVDLTASYGTSGIGGSQNPNFRSPFSLVCNPQDADYQTCLIRQQQQLAQQQAFLQSIGNAGSVFTDILANRYPTLRFGITFNLPLFGDKTTKANLGKTLVQSEQIRTQREQLEQNIQIDVRNALQAIRTAEARLRYAAIARENSQKQYESEQRKLDAGQSDIYRVLERQTALMNARSAELRAQIELNKAIAEFQRATGNSLKINNIETRLR